MQYAVSDGSNKYIIAPAIGVLFSLLFTIIPLKKVCGKRFFAEDAIISNIDLFDYDDFEKQLPGFNSDYMRCNPVTAKKGWEEWLNAVRSNV